MPGHGPKPGPSQNTESQPTPGLGEAQVPPVHLDLNHRHVFVTGIRGGFIEFLFTLADPMLTVELVMPPDAFDAFCRVQNASINAAEGLNMALPGSRACPD